MKKKLLGRFTECALYRAPENDLLHTKPTTAGISRDMPYMHHEMDTCVFGYHI
jgi:hypothetical protein